MPSLDMPSEGSSRSTSWVWMVCFVLLSATFLNYANRFAFTANAIPIQESFNASEAEYGRLAGLFGIGFALGGLTFGILADFISVRKLYPLVLIVWSLAGLSSGLMTTLAGLGAARFVLGLFEAGHWPCALRTTQRVFKPAERTWANSILQSGASLGAVATPQLVLLLYDVNPDYWRWTFFIVGGLGLPWALWWWFTVSEEDVRRPVIQTDETSSGPGEEKQLQEVPFYYLFLTRRWWILLFVVICINTLWHYVRVWMPVMLEKDHGFSRSAVQNFTSVYYLATFFGSLASGWLTQHLARGGRNVHRVRLTIFLIFGLLSSLAIPAAFVHDNAPLLMGLLLVVAFGSLGLFPIYYSLNQELSARNQGKVGGTLGFSTWALLALIHPRIGEMVDHDPTVRPWLMATVGLGPILAFIALALFWGRRPTLDNG